MVVRQTLSCHAVGLLCIHIGHFTSFLVTVMMMQMIDWGIMMILLMKIMITLSPMIMMRRCEE